MCENRVKIKPMPPKHEHNSAFKQLNEIREICLLDQLWAEWVVEEGLEAGRYVEGGLGVVGVLLGLVLQLVKQ